MGGSGYNVSLAAGRAVRRQASSRTPVWFWLEGPFHVIDMGCGPDTEPHEFRSRTPLLESDEDSEGVLVWCGRCAMFRYIGTVDAHPVLDEVTGLPHRDLFRDKRGKLQGVAVEQDDNVLRERAARALQARGFVHSDEDIAEFAVEFGLPVGEVRKINAGLSAPDGGDGSVQLCRAGLHPMSLANIVVKSGRRTCKMCYREADRKAAQARRNRKAAGQAA